MLEFADFPAMQETGQSSRGGAADGVFVSAWAKVKRIDQRSLCIALRIRGL